MERPSEKLTRWSALLFLPVWAGVVGGELGPSSGAPHFWDKAVHFTAYFILSILAVTAVSSAKRVIGVILALIAMGAVLEVIQGAIGRDMSVMDELANGLGVLLGALLALAIRALLVRLHPAD